jgi:hypothetical protein
MRPHSGPPSTSPEPASRIARRRWTWSGWRGFPGCSLTGSHSRKRLQAVGRVSGLTSSAVSDPECAGPGAVGCGVEPGDRWPSGQYGPHSSKTVYGTGGSNGMLPPGRCSRPRISILAAARLCRPGSGRPGSGDCAGRRAVSGGSCSQSHPEDARPDTRRIRLRARSHATAGRGRLGGLRVHSRSGV